VKGPGGSSEKCERRA